MPGSKAVRFSPSAYEATRPLPRSVILNRLKNSPPLTKNLRPRPRSAIPAIDNKANPNNVFTAKKKHSDGTVSDVLVDLINMDVTDIRGNAQSRTRIYEDVVNNMKARAQIRENAAKDKGVLYRVAQILRRNSIGSSVRVHPAPQGGNRKKPKRKSLRAPLRAPSKKPLKKIKRKIIKK